MADCSAAVFCVSIVTLSLAKLCSLMDTEASIVSVISLIITFNWELSSSETDATLVSRSVDH